MRSGVGTRSGRIIAFVCAATLVMAGIEVPARAATGGGAPPPPDCTIFGTAFGTDLRAELDTRFNADLPATATGTSASAILDGYPGWDGSLSNASPSVVSHPTVRFASGLDPAAFVANNSGTQLSSFPWSCGLPSLSTGQQMQSWGIERRNGTPRGEPIAQPIVRDTLGYDSTRTVAPLEIAPGGGEQNVTVTVTPRDGRFASWSWISVFVDVAPNDTIVSMTPPSNLDAGEVLHLNDPSRPAWSIEAAVLNKTYMFSAVVRYANSSTTTWSHVPGAQIYAFTQITPCNFCYTGPSVTLPIPALDGGTPGSGDVTFSIDEPGHTWWDVATKRSYAAKYRAGFWPELHAKYSLQTNAPFLPPMVDAVAGDATFTGNKGWNFFFNNQPAVTAPTLRIDSGYDASLFNLTRPFEPITALPIVQSRPSSSAASGFEFRPIQGRRIPITFQPGYDSSRSSTPLYLPVGGGEQVATVTLRPTSSDIRSFQILLFDDIPGATLLSFTPPSNLDEGERFNRSNALGVVASWQLFGVKVGKTYTLSARISAPNPFPIPVAHRSQWHLFGDILLGGCFGCGGPSSSVSLAEPSFDGPTPGAGRVTFSVGETGFAWHIERGIQRAVRYSSTQPSSLTAIGPSSGAVGDTVSASALLRFGKGPAGPGHVVHLAIGPQSCDAHTSADGTAACAITLAQPGGMSSLTASFAGDDFFYPSRASAPFAIDCFPKVLPFGVGGERNAVELAALKLNDQHTGPAGECGGTFGVEMIHPGVTVATGTFTASSTGTVSTGRLNGTLTSTGRSLPFTATLTLDVARGTGTISETFVTGNHTRTVVVSFARSDGVYVVMHSSQRED